MRDQTIEERLRSTLRAEADELPFTVTVDELERRLLLRRRAAAGRRVGLIAAGVAVVVVGGAIVLATNPFRGTQIATTPQPTIGPSTPPTSSVPATTIPSTVPVTSAPGPLVDPALLDLTNDPEAIDTVLTTIPGDPTSTDTLLSSLTLDPVRQGARAVGIKLVCIGPEPMTLSWNVHQGQDDTPTSIAAETVPCDNTIRGFRYDIAARQPLIDDLLQVAASPRTSYRVLIDTFGETNVPVPAGIPPVATPGGAVLLHMNNLAAASETKTTKVGSVAPRDLYRIAMVCNTVAPVNDASTASWSIGAEGTQAFVDRGQISCDGVPVGVSISPGFAAATSDVFVTAGPGTRWYIVVTSPVPAATFVPPALRLWAGNDLAGATSGPAHCIGYDGNGDSCGLDLTARDGAPVVTAALGGHVSLRVDDGWTIEQASVQVADRAEIRKDPIGVLNREFTVLDDGSGRLTGSGDRMSLSLVGIDRGEWILTVTIQCRKGSHTFGGTYLLPVKVE